MNILKYTEFQMNKPSVVYNPSRSKLEEDNVVADMLPFTFRIYGGENSNTETLKLVSAIREERNSYR